MARGREEPLLGPPPSQQVREDGTDDGQRDEQAEGDEERHAGRPCTGSGA